MAKVTADCKKREVKISFDAKGSLSASGKNEVLASSRGNQVIGVLPDGRPVTLGYNIYVPPKE